MNALDGSVTRRWFMAAGLSLAIFGSHAYGQEWPERPIRLLVGSAAGSSADIPARILAQRLGIELKQSIVVQNRPGASGLIAAKDVAQAKPDGYTLLFAPTSTISITPWTLSNLGWSPDKDLLPIGMLAYTPLAIAVKDSSPFERMGQVIEAARKTPNTLVMANPGMYTLAHLATELIIERAKAPLRAIAFNSFPGSLVAVTNGDAAVLIDGISPILAQANSKGLRILAVSSQERLPGLEAYPLLKDTIPGTTVDGWFGLFAPAGLPSSIAQQLETAMEHVKADPKVFSSLRNLGMYTRMESHGAFATYVHEQSELWRRLVTQLSAEHDKAR